MNSMTGNSENIPWWIDSQSGDEINNLSIKPLDWEDIYYVPMWFNMNNNL